MKKIPFFILLAFCFTGLLCGFFCSARLFNDDEQVAYAQSSTINSASSLFSYIKNYSGANCEDDIVLSGAPSVIDMSGQDPLTATIGTKANPFVGTFDGGGCTISNLTIDLSQSTDDDCYAGLFGALGDGAKIQNVSFKNLTIKTSNANSIFAGLVAYGENCEISNVKIPFDASTKGATLEVGDSSTAYVGSIAGMLKNSSVYGVLVANDIEFSLGNSGNAYAGGVVGKAEMSSTLSNIQVASPNENSLDIVLKNLNKTENVNFEFLNNFNFGGIAGALENSKARNIICRPDNLGQWNFSNLDKKIINVGGAVGASSYSSLILAVLESNFDVSVQADFLGELNLGGAVGRITQKSSKIVNVAMDNEFNIENASGENTCVGEIVGKVANLSPYAHNISFVHFVENSGIEKFGEQGGYSYDASDALSPVDPRLDLNNLQRENGKYTYFENQTWDNLQPWDFKEIWYVPSREIELQNFYDGFYVSVKNSFPDILNFDGIEYEGGTSLTSIPYGKQVTLKYSFKDLPDEAGKMSMFYDLSSLQFKGETSDLDNEVGFLHEDGNYTVSGSNLYSIQVDQEDGQISSFQITINNMNRATSGEYAIQPTPKQFSIKISTILYDTSAGEGEEGVWDDSIKPGLLQVDNGQKSETIELDYLEYGNSRTITAHERTNFPNGEIHIFAPTYEWFVVKTDGEQKVYEPIPVQDEKLEINFGHGIFTQSMEIVAKYTNNACTGVFIIGEGVQKIELGSGKMVIEKSGDSKPISKDDPTLSMDIFIQKGYDFDQQTFIDGLIYKANDPNVAFCKFLNTEELEDSTCYHFELNMKIMNWSNYANQFSVTVNTSKTNTKDNSWIWWVVGFLGGAILIAGIVVLIVWLVKRNRFGGGGKMKINKKAYKNMYY